MYTFEYIFFKSFNRDLSSNYGGELFLGGKGKTQYF